MIKQSLYYYIKKIHPYHLFFRFITIIIVSFNNSEKWFVIACNISKYTKYIPFTKKDIKTPYQIRRLKHIDKILSMLTRTKIEFPIQYTISRFDKINSKNGIILCTSHIPFSKIAIRSYIEKNKNIDFAIIGEATKDGKMAIWGINLKIPALLKDSFVLLKTKNYLLNNKTIVLMVDDTKTGEYSPNIFKLAKKINSNILFFFAEINNSNIIDIKFILPPFPTPINDFEINENINFIKTYSNEIKNRYILDLK